MTETAEKTASRRIGKAFAFESTTCSRCHGTGEHSYCQSYGTTCFKCHGHGITLTKRGIAAQKFYETLLSKRADELEIGDKAYDAGIPGFTGAKWREITSIKPSEQKFKRQGDTEWQIGADHGLIDIAGIMSGCPADRMFRIAATAARKREARDEALAFQATLTKQGKARKS